MIDKQKRLNSLFGISFDEPVIEITDEKIRERSNTLETISTKHSECTTTEQEESQEYILDVDSKDPEVVPEAMMKSEYLDQEAVYEETFETYEPDDTEQQYLLESIKEEQDHNENTSGTEEFEAEVEDDVESTLDQLEEDYQVYPEAEGYEVCTVKVLSDADVESGEEYDIVYEDDITTEEDPPKAKRKYTKQSHDAPKKYSCWIKNCRATFAFRATMKKHMNQIHSIVCDKSTCFICGERYDKYADFLSHVKEHTRKSECDVCKLRFIDDEKLLKHKNRFHKKSDDDERNFQCHVS